MRDTYMPEDELETSELKEKLEESIEEAVEGAERRAHWIVYLSFTTALIAVLAAIASLESGRIPTKRCLKKTKPCLPRRRRPISGLTIKRRASKGRSTLHKPLLPRGRIPNSHPRQSKKLRAMRLKKRKSARPPKSWKRKSRRMASGPITVWNTITGLRMPSQCFKSASRWPPSRH